MIPVVAEALASCDTRSRSRGFGFVRYGQDSDADAAINAMNNVEYAEFYSQYLKAVANIV